MLSLPVKSFLMDLGPWKRHMTNEISYQYSALRKTIISAMLFLINPSGSELLKPIFPSAKPQEEPVHFYLVFPLPVYGCLTQFCRIP